VTCFNVESFLRNLIHIAMVYGLVWIYESSQLRQLTAQEFGTPMIPKGNRGRKDDRRYIHLCINI